MLAKRIIPCLDVHEGRVVKGVNFVNLVDAGDPVAQAQVYDQAGADELVFLDITATHESRDIVTEMVRRVADTVFIPFTVGGGIRTVEDMRAILLAGADKVSINSAAVKTPELISEGAKRFGSQCIVVAMDARRRTGRKFGPAGRGLGCLCQRRAHQHGQGCSGMGQGDRASGRRGDPAHQHGRGRHQSGL